jgi:hypothetical protein
VLNNEAHDGGGHNGRKMRLLEGLADNLTLFMIAAFAILMIVGLFVTNGGS